MRLCFQQLYSITIDMHIADDRMMYYGEHLSVYCDMLILDNLAYIVNRTGRHTVSKTAIGNFLNRIIRGPLFNKVFKLNFIGDTADIVLEAVVIYPLRLVCNMGAKLLKKTLISACNDNKPILCLESIIRRCRGIGVACPFGNMSGIPVTGKNVLKTYEHRIHEGNIDTLTMTDDAAGMNCGKYSYCQIKAAEDISHSVARLYRPALISAGDAHQPTHRLTENIITRALRVSSITPGR